MNRMLAWGRGSLCLATVLCVTSARADIARPDNGCPTVGKACENAGPQGNSSGVCKAEPCSADANSNCPQCEVVDSSSKKDDGGCSLRAIGTEQGVATLLLGLGFAALGVSRRRR